MQNTPMFRIVFSCFSCQHHRRVKRLRANATDLNGVRRIFRRLRGARGVDENELWQHALFFAKSPEERCRLSLQAARSARSLHPSARRKSTVSFGISANLAPRQAVGAEKARRPTQEHITATTRPSGPLPQRRDSCSRSLPGRSWAGVVSRKFGGLANNVSNIDEAG